MGVRSRSSEITDETLYWNRRKFIKTTAKDLLSVTAAAVLVEKLSSTPLSGADDSVIKPKGHYDTDEKLTPYKDVTTCNNFYEFGTDKSDLALNAVNFKSKPWTVTVEGFVKKSAV